jgi:hypothetical protein
MLRVRTEPGDMALARVRSCWIFGHSDIGSVTGNGGASQPQQTL